MMKKVLYILFITVIIFFALLEYGNLTGGVLKDKAIAIGYFSSAGYTLIFGFLLRQKLQALFTRIQNQTLFFTIMGTVGAIFVETVIWFAQTSLHATGAAIHPNLLVDLVMTVPFYTLLCYFMAKWVIKFDFSWQVVALAGGIYETGADGVVGNLVQLNFLGALISPVLIPLFIIMYSPIILVPFLLFSRVISPLPVTASDYKIIFKPLLALLIVPVSLGAGFLLGKIL